MSGDRGPRGRTIAQHHVENARRDARADGQFGHEQGGIGRHLGRFQHHGIARSQGRPQLPTGHRDREIPRRDRADHTVRFIRDIAKVAVRHRRQRAAFLVRKLGKEADLFSRHHDVACQHMRIGTRRTDRFKCCQRFGFGRHQIGPGAQGAGAVARLHPAPVRRPKRGAGGLNRAVHHIRISAGDFTDDCTGGRRHDVQRRSASDIFSADKMRIGKGQIAGIIGKGHRAPRIARITYRIAGNMYKQVLKVWTAQHHPPSDRRRQQIMSRVGPPPCPDRR